MTFGQIIKKLRRDADMTQEQLAEALSISGQAVSRWECDAAMPDISLIPVLANLFDVTTDYLLGVDITKKKERIHEILISAEQKSKPGYKREAVAILRDGLREFPGSFELIYHLQCELYSYSGQLSRDERKPLLEEVVALGERILADCTDESLRNGAIQWLCFSYVQLDMHEKAEKLADTMPGIWITREYLRTRILRGQRQFEAKRDELHMLISRAVSGLQALSTDIDGKPALTPEEEKSVLEKALALIDLLCENGDYGEYEAYRGGIFRQLAELAFDAGDDERALDLIEMSLECGIMLDSSYDEHAKHTSLLLRGQEYGGFSFSDRENFSMMLLKLLEKQGRIKRLAVSERGRAILERIEENAARR